MEGTSMPDPQVVGPARESSPAAEPAPSTGPAPSTKKYAVTFQPSGRRGLADEGRDLLSVARDFGVEIESICGGQGTCKKCRIKIESPPETVSSPTPAEEKTFSAEALAAGMRLACQTRVRGNVKVFVPEQSRRSQQVVRKEAGERTVPLDPAVRAFRVTLPLPTLHHALADAERLAKALREQHGLAELSFDFLVLQSLPSVLRQAAWQVEAVVWEEQTVIDVRPAAPERPLLGLAVDVGTTTIAAYLTDLRTGEVVATESAMNPQVAFGDDVIARLYYVVHHEGGLDELQQNVSNEVNRLARRALERAGASPHDIYDVVMVGNTAMHHLFLGLQPRALGVSPFTPAVQGAVDALASDIGLSFNPRCRLHVLPVEAGFVGADNVAVIIAEEPYKKQQVDLLIDIGTNGELVLGNRDRMLSTSCATGPAFEGSHIEFGMRAAPGAIERVRIEPGTLEVRFKVIGLEGWHTAYPPQEVAARGICGSGIIEAAAEMRKAGILLENGNFDPDLRHERIVTEEGKPRKFIIARAEETALGRDITVSLKDIRSIQLAKAALRAGAEILLARYGLEKPDGVILAGAFGSYIDKHHALALGMLPDCPPDKVISVGNAAGDGARFALLNRGKRQEAAWAAQNVEFVELAIDPDFQRQYVAAMSFPAVKDIPDD
jgi:uncharacterized 2Fe-2S/4Fe-4S cluster protein (DUF4445 family)